MQNDLKLNEHISQRYNDEIEQVQSLIKKMGQTVISQVNLGLETILELDLDKANALINNDKQVNKLEVEIDNICTRILATRQPAASDLRLIFSAIKTTTDLERIGDEALKLGRNAIKVSNSQSGVRPFTELQHLGLQVCSNLTTAINAYCDLDPELAIEVIQQDEEINQEFDNISRLLLTKMLEDPREIKNALRITWSARALERIGDHAKNIAEHAVFLVKGKDIRHLDLADIRARV